MLYDNEKTGGSQVITANAYNKYKSREILLLSGCRECHICLQQCPLHKGKEAGTTMEMALTQGCINCGLCLGNCPEKAIEYQDDMELFLQDLARGRQISLLVAPAVQRHFSDYRQVFGFLQSLGVRKFYNVVLRADITLWAYGRILESNYGKPFISSPCAAVTDYIMNHVPALRPHLMPVYSPLVCSAVFLKKYRQVDYDLAFLSSCIGKRGDLRQSGNKVRYSVTIGKLKQYIVERGIDLSRYEAVDFADSNEGQGVTLGASGSVCASLREQLPDRLFRKISGSGVYPYLTEYEAALKAGELLPDLLEIYNCKAGCDSGTGTGEMPPGVVPPKSAFGNADLQQEAAAAFDFFNSTLDIADFIWPEIKRYDTHGKDRGRI